MNRSVTLCLVVSAVVAVACSSSQRAQTKVQRKALEKQRREYKTPTNYNQRERGYDQKTGKVVTYDHKPRVELLDDKTGKYAFKWIGYDGKEKAVVFQRGDVLDVVVTASVSRTPDNRYLYTYTVENLPASATYLKRFVVQNFAGDVTADKGGPFMAFTMSKSIKQFQEGNWLSFDDVSDEVQINPGPKVEIRLRSAAPPGLVECRASIETVMNGGGEEMPSALEDLLPGYEDFPKGYTIGPVQTLSTFSLPQRTNYLLQKLPECQAVGWITDEVAKRYETALRNGRVNDILGRLDKDLQSEQITPEVAAIILQVLSQHEN